MAECPQEQPEELLQFEQKCEEYTRQGYETQDCTISLTRANGMGFVTALPSVILFILLYIFVSAEKKAISSDKLYDLLLLAVAMIVSIPVHELLHALFWGIVNGSFHGLRIVFAKNPYCACSIAMGRGKYLVGSLAPCVILGIGLSVAGIVTGYAVLLLIGLYNLFCAGADMLISLKTLFSGRGILLDHPQRCGYYRFYKEK